MMAKMGIYKYTNNLNGNVYIGKSVDIAQRKREHRYEAKHNRDNSIFHKALRKYGEENFSFEIIEECFENELDEREKYWIKFYNSVTPNGYNISLGGDGGHAIIFEKIVEQYDLQGNFIKEYKSASEAARQLNLFKSNITSACRGESTQCGGFQWKYKNENKEIKKDIEKRQGSKKKPVIMYNENKEKIKKFNSVSDAAKEVGCWPNAVKSCCIGNLNALTHKCKGLYFTYESEKGE